MYEVMARRYRPAQFDEVVGQEHIAATLKNAITRGRVAHAYIFTGGHGCGKTTMARILAKALVCQNGPTPTPCGVCPICLDVAAGRDADVLEIDGASNNGIEQIRQLRDQAAYVPSRARFKIYIIDEVHMLSDGAFNALLKTLEEPPKHVKFILATTDPHKVPDTILSRCQRFDFRLVPGPILVKFFRELTGREQAAMQQDALEAVAAFAEGSVRDGLVLLDQVLSFTDGEVTRQEVEAVRGVASAESVAGIFACIDAGDVRGALALVDETAARGTSVGDFLDQLISFGRDLMLLSAGAGKESVTAYGPARESLYRLAEKTDLEAALLYLDVFTQARTRVRTRALTNPLVALEMAVARLAGLGGVVPVAEIVAGLGELPQAARAEGSANQERRPQPAALEVKAEAVKTEPYSQVKPEPNSQETAKPEPVKPEPVKPEAIKPEASQTKAVAVEAAPLKPDLLKLDTVKPDAGEPAAVTPKAARAEAPDRRKTHPADQDVVFTTEDEYWDDGHEEALAAGKMGTPPRADRPAVAVSPAASLPAKEVDPPFDADPPAATVPAKPPAEAVPAASSIAPAEAAPTPAASGEPLSLDYVNRKWSAILDAMADKYPADYRHLHHLSVGAVEAKGGIQFTGRATAIEPWEDPFRLERFTKVLAEVLGRRVEATFTAAKGKRAAAPAAGSASGQDKPSGKAKNKQGDGVPGLAQKPAVEMVRSLFDGVIINYHNPAEEDKPADPESGNDE